MNVNLATQLLSQYTVEMIRDAIANDNIVLSLQIKGMYNHVADLCEHWNGVADICNSQDGLHMPGNAAQRQTVLLEMLAWFSRWKELHDKRVEEKHATAYNFFANDETWFCIKLLLLDHITIIQLYCVIKGESISLQTMNTDTVNGFLAIVLSRLAELKKTRKVLGAC